MYASQIKVLDDKTLQVTQEVDGGLQTVTLDLPAVVTVDLRLNTPRLCTLQNIMRAKSKPLHVETLESLQMAPESLRDTFEIVKTEEPAKRKPGVMVASVDELIERLRSEAKIIPVK